MHFVKKAFGKTVNAVTPVIAAAISVIAVFTFLVSGTLAADNDITDTFNPVSDAYPKIPVSGTNSDVRGTKAAISSNVSIISTDTTRIPPVLTGVAPGVASVAYLTSIGTGRNINYQVYDPNGIAGYRIPGGAMEVFQPRGNPQPVNIMLYIDVQNNGNKSEVTWTDWNSKHAENKVQWKSLQPGVVTVDQATGYFTALTSGSAILTGTLTDKWGVKQSVSVLINIGTGNIVGPTPNTTSPPDGTVIPPNGGGSSSGGSVGVIPSDVP